MFTWTSSDNLGFQARIFPCPCYGLTKGPSACKTAPLLLNFKLGDVIILNLWLSACSAGFYHWILVFLFLNLPPRLGLGKETYETYCSCTTDLELPSGGERGVSLFHHKQFVTNRHTPKSSTSHFPIWMNDSHTLTSSVWGRGKSANSHSYTFQHFTSENIEKLETFMCTNQGTQPETPPLHYTLRKVALYLLHSIYWQLSLMCCFKNPRKCLCWRQKLCPGDW